MLRKGISRLCGCIAATAVLAFAMVLPAVAADLKIALKYPNISIDPHFLTSPNAFQVNAQIFEPLVFRNENSVIQPWLARSWDMPNPTTWIFHLRNDVKWHDGSSFTAEDVVFAYQRARSVPKSPSSFAVYLNEVASAEAVDAHTLRIVTKEPAPSLLEKLGNVLIVSKKHGEAATTESYHLGQSAIGTGPYKFVSWRPNDTTQLARNPNYWRGLPTWDNVTYRIIENDASRVAALLSGDVDAIETVPTQEIERLRKSATIDVIGYETTRVSYLSMDGGTEVLSTQTITGPNGERLDKNPLADPRVRRALKLAIDLKPIISRLYQGNAVATGQMLPSKVPGYNPKITAWAPDPAEARRLLEASGWANKFKLNLVVSGTIFQNAVQTAEVVAQFWTRIGVHTTVTTVPHQVFMKIGNGREGAVLLFSYQNSVGTADNLFPILLHSRTPSRSFGGLNYTRYSNAEVDRLIDEAMGTIDNKARMTLYEKVMAAVDADTGVIPLWLLHETTAMRKGLTYVPRYDRQIYPDNFKASASQ